MFPEALEVEGVIVLRGVARPRGGRDEGTWAAQVGEEVDGRRLARTQRGHVGEVVDQSAEAVEAHSREPRLAADVDDVVAAVEGARQVVREGEGLRLQVVAAPDVFDKAAERGDGDGREAPDSRRRHRPGEVDEGLRQGRVGRDGDGGVGLRAHLVVTEAEGVGVVLRLQVGQRQRVGKEDALALEPATDAVGQESVGRLTREPEDKKVFR
jgi:hypothetical protein